MTPRLVRCGPVKISDAPRSWRKNDRLDLRIGRGKNDVHLRISHLSRSLTASLPPIAADLVELASYVYVADQAVGRGGKVEFEYGTKWRRSFRFVVPVRDPDRWNAPPLSKSLRVLLGFLSDDDSYEFHFVKHPSPPEIDRYLTGGPEGGECEEIMMFSGGLDSLAGAVHECVQGQRRVALVSHAPVNHHRLTQERLVGSLKSRIAAPTKQPLHVSVEINKGLNLENEFT